MIYFAVRDPDWQTLPGFIRNEQIQTTADSFLINYTYHIHQDAIQIKWRVNITG